MGSCSIFSNSIQQGRQIGQMNLARILEWIRRVVHRKVDHAARIICVKKEVKRKALGL